MQKFVSQPNKDGLYEIARWNEHTNKYETMRISFLPTPLECITIELARFLNEL